MTNPNKLSKTNISRKTKFDKQKKASSIFCPPLQMVSTAGAELDPKARYSI